MTQGGDTKPVVAEYGDGKTLSVTLFWALVAPKEESTKAGTMARKVCQEDKKGKTDIGWFGSHSGGWGRPVYTGGGQGSSGWTCRVWRTRRPELLRLMTVSIWVGICCCAPVSGSNGQQQRETHTLTRPNDTGPCSPVSSELRNSPIWSSTVLPAECAPGDSMHPKCCTEWVVLGLNLPPSSCWGFLQWFMLISPILGANRGAVLKCSYLQHACRTPHHVSSRLTYCVWAQAQLLNAYVPGESLVWCLTALSSVVSQLCLVLPDTS